MARLTNHSYGCRRDAYFRPETAEGFTLIELLVVIAIIALLVSILLPSLQKAKDLAKIAACQSIFRGIGLAQELYIADNETYPCLYNKQDNSMWSMLIWDYVGGDIKAYACPSNEYTPPDWSIGIYPGLNSYAVNVRVMDSVGDPYSSADIDRDGHTGGRRPDEIVRTSAKITNMELLSPRHFLGLNNYDGWCFQQGFTWGYKVGGMVNLYKEYDRGEYHLGKAGNYLFADGHIELIDMYDDMSQWVIDGERYPPASNNPWAVEK